MANPNIAYAHYTRELQQARLALAEIELAQSHLASARATLARSCFQSELSTLEEARVALTRASTRQAAALALWLPESRNI